MNKLFAQLVNQRGLDDTFLNPKYELLSPPSIMPDIKKAISRIQRAVQNQEKILIYGDYDVDGITATTLMEEALHLAGIQDIDIMLPDRFVDGYGMSPRLITRVKQKKPSLVITVDCGSRNFDIIKELNALNIDTIITDHHECEDTLPDAVAIINPKRQDFQGSSSLRDLSGVGVAFKLATGLVEAGLIPTGQEKWLLDLVLIGTICDSMKLTGENRILCYYGIKVLSKTRRPGLIELMKKAGVKKITSESIGFQIGPRLNAAGRLDTAELALKLLRTKSHTEAAALTEKLETLNQNRRKAQNLATEEISHRDFQANPVIIEAGDWHEGILGIVAGRLVEKYRKPAFVLTESEKGILKGSGRSFGDFNLAKALTSVNDIIISGGGHAAAAGVRLDKSNFSTFRDKINQYYQNLNLQNQEQYFKKLPDLNISNLADFSLDFLDNLSSLEPFGIGNEEPLFCFKDVDIIETHRLGQDGKHLRLDVKGKDQKIIKCMAFFAPESWFALGRDTTHNLLIRPTINEFRGVRTPEARLIDVV